MRAQQLREVVVAGAERDAIAVALLADQREQQPQQRREVFLDVGGDHARSGVRGCTRLTRS